MLICIEDLDTAITYFDFVIGTEHFHFIPYELSSIVCWILDQCPELAYYVLEHEFDFHLS